MEEEDQRIVSGNEKEGGLSMGVLLFIEIRFLFLFPSPCFVSHNGHHRLHRKKKAQTTRKKETKPVVPGSLKDRILKLQAKNSK